MESRRLQIPGSNSVRLSRGPALHAAMFSKNKRPYDPGELQPRQRLRRNVQDLLATNSLSGNRLHEIACDVNRVDSASFPDFARNSQARPDNLPRSMFRKFLKRSTWMQPYWAQVRCMNTKTEKLELEWLAIRPPHEIVHVLRKHGLLEKLMERKGLDPLSRQHLESCDLEAGLKLLGLGLWADGTPCNWDRSESVETLCLSLPGLTGKFATFRVAITALSGKNCTAETWIDICKVVKWSLQVLASGQWPSCRHDGTAWLKSDAKRKDPRPIIQAALAEVRADWEWMAKVYGFPRHNVKTGCCWKCKCTPEQVRALYPIYEYAVGRNSNHLSPGEILKANGKSYQVFPSADEAMKDVLYLVDKNMAKHGWRAADHPPDLE